MRPDFEFFESARSRELRLQEELKRNASRCGIRVVGPNCQGVNYPHHGLCASWPLITTRGKIAFASQSGTVGAAFLDLAAKACPQRVEATFFALLMSIFNLGSQASQSIGAHLYTVLGEGQRAYGELVLISTATTALIWLLVPLVRIERIEAAARAGTEAAR